MTKKELAQKRNYFKYVLSGMVKPIDYGSLNEWELEEWATILDIRDDLLSKFDENSKLQGLKIPEHRCWCGKEAKYELEKPLFNHGYWVCKKHKEDEI